MLREPQHERIPSLNLLNFSAHPELLSPKIFAWRAEVGKGSCGVAEQLLDGGVASGAHRGGGEAAPLGELIAVRLGDLADNAMGPEEAQEATDSARQAARVHLGCRWRIQVLAQGAGAGAREHK